MEQSSFFKRIFSKQNIPNITSYILALIISNLGISLIKQKPEFILIGIISIILGFIIVYFTTYMNQINKNEEEISNLFQEMDSLKKNIEINEELLNTIKDIVILNKISKSQK